MTSHTVWIVHEALGIELVNVSSGMHFFFFLNNLSNQFSTLTVWKTAKVDKGLPDL